LGGKHNFASSQTRKSMRKIKDIKIKDILALFKRKGSMEKKNLYSPRKDWTIIVIIFFIVMALTIAGNYTLYLLVDGGVVFNKSAEQEAFKAVLKRDVIEEVVAEFENRKLNTDSFSEIRQDLADPS